MADTRTSTEQYELDRLRQIDYPGNPNGGAIHDRIKQLEARISFKEREELERRTAESWEKQLDRLREGPPPLSEGQKTAMQVQEKQLAYQRVPFSMRENARAQVAQHIGRSMDDILSRAINRREADAIDNKEAFVSESFSDDDWADSRAETLKFKLAEAQQRAQQERMRQEAEVLRQQHEAVLNASLRRRAGDAIRYDLSPAVEPKKPIEIPILTFGKRRINLKDVA